MAGIKIQVSTEEAKKATENLRKTLQQLGLQSKMTENQIQGLEKRLVNQMGMDKGKKTMDGMARSIGLTKTEIADFHRTLGTAPSLIDAETSSMLKMGAGFVGVTGAMMVAERSMAAFYGTMQKGWKAVETYNMSVAQMAAMVMTFAEKRPGQTQADQWKEALGYSRQMIPVLEQLAAKTLLSGEETTALANAFARAGVFLDASNSKQIQSFTAISNALPMLTQGQAIMMQINQEIRGLMTGEREAGSMLLQTLKAQDPLIKEHLKTWRANNEVMENVARLLSGFVPATELIENEWQTVKSTLDTTANQILRGQMKPIYEELISLAKDFNDWLQKNQLSTGSWGETVAGMIKAARDSVKYLKLFMKSPYQPEKEWDVQVIHPPKPPPKGKKPAQDQDELKKIQQFKEKVADLKRELQETIDAPVESDLGSKLDADLAKIMKKYGDIRAKDEAKAPGVLGQINKAQAQEELKVALDYENKTREGVQKFNEKKSAIYQKGYEGAVQLDKDLTTAGASELEKRKLANKQLEQERITLAVAAAEAGVYTEQGFQKEISRIRTQTEKDDLKTEKDYYAQIDEMRISQRLSELDGLEQMGLAHRKTLDERISLVSKELEVSKGILDTLDPTKQTEAYLQQQAKMIERQKTLNALNREASMQDLYKAMELGLDELYNEWTDTGKQMYDLSKQVANDMQGAFSDFFFDAMTGKLKSFGDYVTSFLNSVSRSIANVLAERAAVGIIGSIGSITGGSEGVINTSYQAPTGVYSSTLPALGSHTGGMMNEPTFIRHISEMAFINAQRAHTGIGPGEKPVIIKDDEGVFTKGQMAALAPVNQKTQNVKVEIINESGQKMEVKNSEAKFNPQEIIVTLWIDAATRNAYGLRDMLGG